MECGEEKPLPAEEELPTPPSPPPETTPSPVTTTTNTDTTATPSSPKQQRRSKRKKQRPWPVGGADGEDGGMVGRGEGVREGGKDESGDDLEFHDAHSEMPGNGQLSPLANYMHIMYVHVYV